MWLPLTCTQTKLLKTFDKVHGCKWYEDPTIKWEIYYAHSLVFWIVAPIVLIGFGDV